MIEIRTLISHSYRYKSEEYLISWGMGSGLRFLQSPLTLINIMMCFFNGFRSQAQVECTMWSQQCHHLPRSLMVEAVVLVVVAGPPIRHRLA